jgi:hypothetical protein
MKKVLIVIAAVAATLPACTEDETSAPQGPTRLEATSPANVLRNVATAFNQRSTGLLKDMLSPDFMFYFDPADVGHHPPERLYVIPEFWYYDEFWTAVDNMYILAYSVSLAVPAGEIGTPAESATTYEADGLSLRFRVLVNEMSGYQAEEGYCDYAFESYVGKGGQKYWRLAGWWDHTAVSEDAYAGREPASLGSAIASFR